MHDRFSQSMPWESEEQTVDVVDWKGERLVVGQVYIDFGNDWVHEDERLDYVDDRFVKLEVQEGMQ